MKRKLVILNISAGILNKVITLLLAIILPKLIIENYGSEYNGLVSSISGIFVYLNLLEAGVGGASIQALYSQIIHKNQDKINGILSATSKYYTKTGIYFLACVSVMAFLYPFIAHSKINYASIVAIVLISAAPTLISYFFQGKYNILITADNKSYIAAVFTTVLNIASNIVKIVLILSGQDIIVVLLSASILSLLNAIIFVRYIKTRYSNLNTFVKPDYKAISKKNDVMAFQILGIIIHNTDVLILTIFCDLKVVSIYTIYNMIFSQVSSFPQAIAKGIIAGMGHLYNENLEKFKSFYDFYETYFLGVLFIGFVTAYIFTIPFLKLYISGTDINYIDKWLPLLFILNTLQEGIRIPSGDVFTITGDYKELKGYAITEAVLNITFTLILVKFLGIYGVLLGTFLSMFYFTFSSIIYVSRNILHRSSLIPLQRAVVCVFLAAIIIVFFNKINIIILNYSQLLMYSVFAFILISIIYVTVISITNRKARSLLFEYVKPIYRKMVG